MKTICAILPGLVALQSPDQSKPAGEAAPSLQPQLVIETNQGNIVVELDAEKAPAMVLNFLDYVASGFYDDTVFHRVVKGRMIHGGGYTKDLKLKESGLREPVRYEGGNGLLHNPGTIAAYRRVDNYNSAQSQFFINTNTNNDLDRLKDGSSYTVFGRVLDGMDVVTKIENAEVGTHPALAAGLSPYVPKEPVVIKSIKIKTPLDRAKARQFADRNAEAAADPVGFRTKQLESDCKAQAQETKSGLKFIECKAGNGAFPFAQEDTVEISFVATLANGYEFDSSKARGAGPLVTKVKDMIRGLREGIPMMREGGRTIFVIPSELAFGKEGYIGKVPPGATTFYDVTLESVKAAP